MLAILLTCVLTAAGCGDGDEGRRAQDRSTERTETETGQPKESPTAAPEPLPEGELPPIRVESPAAFETLVGSFVLSGTAKVHEGTLAWAILDAKLEPMVRGTTTASCGAPCRGRFRTRVSLRGVPVGSWELHVWSPNVSDEGPERLHDTMVPISVAKHRVEGAPEPGEEPPGGPPPG